MPKLTTEFLTKLLRENPGRFAVKILREKGAEDVIYEWDSFKHIDIAQREGIQSQNIAYAGGLLPKHGGDTLILSHGGHSMSEYQPDPEEEKITITIIQGLLGQIDPDFKLEKFNK